MSEILAVRMAQGTQGRPMNSITRRLRSVANEYRNKNPNAAIRLIVWDPCSLSEHHA
jgi:hypothetical protein